MASFDSMSNPANTLPPDFDESLPKTYDPVYTADISEKMRVADRIVVNGYDMENDFRRENHIPDPMKVPEKIMLAGQDGHFAARTDPSFELDINPHVIPSQYVGLTTPPRVLTMDQMNFPNMEEEADIIRKINKSQNTSLVENGIISATPNRSFVSERIDDSLYTPDPNESIILDGEDEMAHLRRQISKIARKMVYLEHENQKRKNRELYIYPIVLGYILFGAFRWLFSGK